MRTSDTPEPLATSAEVAAFLNIPVRTLDQWAYRGLGPAYVKIGRHRRYHWRAVRAFAEPKPAA